MYDVKVKMEFVDDSGKSKTTSKYFLADASSIVDANEQGARYMENYGGITGWEITGVQQSKISDVIEITDNLQSNREGVK